jgi:hypothetical protein
VARGKDADPHRSHDHGDDELLPPPVGPGGAETEIGVERKKDRKIDPSAA